MPPSAGRPVGRSPGRRVARRPVPRRAVAPSAGRSARLPPLATAGGRLATLRSRRPLISVQHGVLVAFDRVFYLEAQQVRCAAPRTA